RASSPAPTAEVRQDDRSSRPLATAAHGEQIELAFPARGPLAKIATFFDRAADARLDDLIAMGRSLLGRLEREGCQVNVSIERESADVRVANTAGAAGDYRSTGGALRADVWGSAGDDVVAGGGGPAGADLPGGQVLATRAASINPPRQAPLRQRV